MALDFEALRKKLSTLQGQNDRSTATWKPPAGKSVIRIVPWKERPDNPFVELFFHYLGRKTQLSPLTNGSPDPIAEFSDKLRSTGDKDDWQFSKQFSPKLRTYVPIVVRGEEDKGVRFWGFGKTVYTQLLAIIDDEDWGDITDPKSGHDIGIEYIPEKESDTNFAQTKILVKPKETALSDDAKQLEQWLETQPDIKEVYPEPTYDELASFLERFLNPEADASVTAAKTSAAAPAIGDPKISEGNTEAPAKDAETVTEEAEDDSEEGDGDVAQEFERLFNS